jgi:hypothetical protein
LAREAIREAGDFDSFSEAIVVDEHGDLLSGLPSAAAVCRAETRGDAEIEVLMVLDRELAARLEAADLERDECLEEVLEEAERSDTDD